MAPVSAQLALGPRLWRLTWYGVAFAAAERFVVVTENIVDFAVIAVRWATEGLVHTGLIFTSPKRFHRATIAYPGNLVVAKRALLHEPPDIGASGTWWL